MSAHRLRNRDAKLDGHFADVYVQVGIYDDADIQV